MTQLDRRSVPPNPSRTSLDDRATNDLIALKRPSVSRHMTSVTSVGVSILAGRTLVYVYPPDRKWTNLFEWTESHMPNPLHQAPSANSAARSAIAGRT